MATYGKFTFEFSAKVSQIIFSHKIMINFGARILKLAQQLSLNLMPEECSKYTMHCVFTCGLCALISLKHCQRSR